jgi:DNA repair protein RecN (Recombination protein N)
VKVKSLYIKNLAVIDEMTINFKSGLNIITGETGAGKSLIVNALKYLTGARFPKEMIRTQSDGTVIEGVFIDGNNSHTLRRIMSKTGQSKIYLDDEPIKLKQLKLISINFLDIHSQHEHQNLLNREYHLDYLDLFGQYDHLLVELKESYTNLKSEISKLGQLLSDKSELNEKIELYQFQANELSQHSFKKDDDQKYHHLYKKLTNASAIRESLEEISSTLDETDHSVKDGLFIVEKELQKILNHDLSIKSVIERLSDLFIEIDDISGDLEKYKNSIVVDDDQINEVGEKLGYLETISRKYGGSLESATEYLIFLNQKLNKKESFDEDINLQERKISQIRQRYNKLALQVSRLREKAAVEFQDSVCNLLLGMDMENTKFIVKLSKLPDGKFISTGLDECEFFISTNIGEDLNPFIKVVSGGETSRFMLAVKIVLLDKNSSPSLVFDEVDNGISGSTAEKIGGILESLSNSHQIICITHLPQIAAKGNDHFRIYKIEENNRTMTKFMNLDKTSRINEIAGLISGSDITKSGISQAKELLRGSNG